MVDCFEIGDKVICDAFENQSYIGVIKGIDGFRAFFLPDDEKNGFWVHLNTCRHYFSSGLQYKDVDLYKASVRITNATLTVKKCRIALDEAEKELEDALDDLNLQKSRNENELHFLKECMATIKKKYGRRLFK